MFVALWEYEVKPGSEETFEKAYGLEREWAELFRKDANYQGTRLLRDASRPGMYLTMDFWKSQRALEKFMAAHKEEDKRLDAAGEELTLRGRCIG